jgi:HD superfamily phosphodiesterase
MHTKTAKKLAEQRTEFMELFLNQLRKEMVHSSWRRTQN